MVGRPPSARARPRPPGARLQIQGRPRPRPSRAAALWGSFRPPQDAGVSLRAPPLAVGPQGQSPPTCGASEARPPGRRSRRRLDPGNPRPPPLRDPRNLTPPLSEPGGLGSAESTAPPPTRTRRFGRPRPFQQFPPRDRTPHPEASAVRSPLPRAHPTCQRPVRVAAPLQIVPPSPESTTSGTATRSPGGATPYVARHAPSSTHRPRADPPAPLSSPRHLGGAGSPGPAPGEPGAPPSSERNAAAPPPRPVQPRAPPT
ncbi:proline-rich protein 36-like [Choloepus didactylus]|uniref:proline-rich protein 36-like n=1 Tax=Choloepus didactylus TaxID=27675 RepID=UPI00189F9803|nr:proline-rich protein 36-like [Choloepus didactylus]